MYYKSKIWGPFGWYFLHSLSYFSYYNKLNDKEKEGLKNIISSLTNAIPCPECRKNYSIKHKKVNLDDLVNDPNYFVNWVIQIHNEVNRSNKKPQYTREQVDILYTIGGEKQIINQHQIVKFLEILVKSGRYLYQKQMENGFRQLFYGISMFFPEKGISEEIERYLSMNRIDYTKLSSIEKNWNIMNNMIFERIRRRDNNICFEVFVRHLKTNLEEYVYFKPNMCGITTLQKWDSDGNKAILQCRNYDGSMKTISFDVNPNYKIKSVKSMDYLNLTIDIRTGKRKNNIVQF